MSMNPASPAAEGVRLLQAGDFQGAVTRLQEAVHANPSDGQAYGYLGIAQCRLGNADAGIAALQEAGRLQPLDAGARFNLAVALTQAQRTAEARQALEQTLALNPQHAQARAALDRLGAGQAVTAVQPALGAQPAAPMTDLAGNPVAQPAPAAPTYGSAYPPAAPPPQAGAYGAGQYGGAQYGAPGMQYQPPAQPTLVAPPAGLRIMRGLGWGAMFGQWWTIWVVFWDLIVHNGGELGVSGVIFGAILLAFVFGIAGALIGLIIGATNAGIGPGAIIGVVAGMCFLGIEFMMSQSGFVLVNVIFWFFTGRFVGALIASRVNRPVTR